MLDFRIQTFLTLCETMNYTRAAQRLCITQPAVTQHIQYLETYYGGKLFIYKNKTLSLTERGRRLELAAKSMRNSSEGLHRRLQSLEEPRQPLRLGATKTIGDYVILNKICRYLEQGGGRKLTLTVDNTQNLLAQLEAGQLDLTLIEGYFDKQRYTYRLMRRESFIGICHAEHPFAGQKVGFDELFSETLLVREPGSGTRAIFEGALRQHNYTLDNFSGIIQIGSFSVICRMVQRAVGVSFLYRSILDSGQFSGLAAFEIENTPIFHEFNYVFLHNNLFLPEFESFIETPL